MGLIYFLKHSLNLHVKNGSVPVFHGIHYTSIALQEDDIPGNQTNIYLREGNLSSKLNKWVKKPGAFP